MGSLKSFEKCRDELSWELSRTAWADIVHLYTSPVNITWWVQGHCGGVSPISPPLSHLTFSDPVTYPSMSFTRPPTPCPQVFPSRILCFSHVKHHLCTLVNAIFCPCDALPNLSFARQTSLYLLSKLWIKYHLFVDICLFLIPLSFLIPQSWSVSFSVPTVSINISCITYNSTFIPLHI